MKKHIILIGLILFLVINLLTGCDEQVNNKDIPIKINETFHTNTSAPYRFWRLEINKDTPIRVQGTLNNLENGETPKVDFVFFDGYTNDNFPKLSSFNASTIDKTWTIPYDGTFFFGIECKYEYYNVTGNVKIYY